MAFPSRTFRLNAPPERVKQAFLHRVLKPLFTKSFLLSWGRAARHIHWRQESASVLIGKLGFWRGRYQCVYRFRAIVEPFGSGSQVTLSAEHGPFSKLVLVIGYVFGFLLFIVGALFVWLHQRFVLWTLGKMIARTEQYLIEWDRASVGLPSEAQTPSGSPLAPGAPRAARDAAGTCADDAGVAPAPAEGLQASAAQEPARWVPPPPPPDRTPLVLAVVFGVLLLLAAIAAAVNWGPSAVCFVRSFEADPARARSLAEEAVVAKLPPVEVFDRSVSELKITDRHRSPSTATALVEVKLREDLFSVADADAELVKAGDEIARFWRARSLAAKREAEPPGCSPGLIRKQFDAGATTGYEVVLPIRRERGQWQAGGPARLRVLYGRPFDPPLFPRKNLPETHALLGTPEADRVIREAIEARKKFVQEVEQEVAVAKRTPPPQTPYDSNDPMKDLVARFERLVNGEVVPGNAADGYKPLPGERFPETRLLPLQQSHVERWSAEDLRYAINEMFARHGAEFPKEAVRRTFERFDWYQPRPGLDFDQIEEGFSEMEKANLKLLAAARDAASSRAAAKPPANRAWYEGSFVYSTRSETDSETKYVVNTVTIRGTSFTYIMTENARLKEGKSYRNQKLRGATGKFHKTQYVGTILSSDDTKVLVRVTANRLVEDNPKGWFGRLPPFQPDQWTFVRTPRGIAANDGEVEYERQ